MALLQAAYDPEKSNVYVDFQTKKLASREMDFAYVKHLELPKKVLNFAVYKAVQG
jgi:hypothetical protein